MNDQNRVTQEPVIAVGAGPAGCTTALLLADYGIPVTLLERHTQPHPLPRAVHLDNEVARTLDRIGVSEGFLARSRPGSGLRLLDASHHVMAEFSRGHQASEHGFPQANMFHQPDLEELMLARIERHPLIDFRRGAEVTGLEGAQGPVGAAPVRVHARVAGETQTFTGPVVLGCDGANSTISQLAGITMDDLGFTERWLVVDIQRQRRPGHLGRRRADLRPRPRRHLHAGHRRLVPLGVPAARRRGRSRPDHPGRPRPAAAALDRAQRPGRPADHPQRQLHVPRPDGVPLPRRAGLPARRRRPPHPAVHRPGPGGRATRRRQPGLEARPRAHRPGRTGPACQLRDRTPPARPGPDEKGRPGRLGDDRRAGPRRHSPPDRPGRRGPQRPHLPGHGLHRHPAAQDRRPAAIPAALPPVRHSPRAAGRRPDPQPAGIRRRRHAGPAGRHLGRAPRRADRTTPRRRTGRFLPPARPGPGADQRTRDRHAPRTGRPAGRRLDRRPSRRRRNARRPARPGSRPGADRPRPPGPRGRRR